MASTIISVLGVVLGLLACGIATWTSYHINRINTKKELQSQLDEILKIAIQYPILERPSFTKTWFENEKSEKDEYIRYDTYCICIFNLLQRICKFYRYKERKIKNHLNIKPWIRLHEQRWKKPPALLKEKNGYEEKFQKLMEKYLKGDSQ